MTRAGAMNVLALIKQRPEPYVEGAKVACPECGTLCTPRPGSCTLVGGGRAFNHYWDPCECPDCGLKFTRESLGDSQWITGKRSEAGRHVYSGVSTCYESYIYTCAYCSGEVQREVRNLDGTPNTSGVLMASNANGNWVKQYQYVYVCRGCGKEVAE